MNYLLDVFIFTPEDLMLNATVLLWPQKINPIFDENDDVKIFSLYIMYSNLFGVIQHFNSSFSSLLTIVQASHIK